MRFRFFAATIAMTLAIGVSAARGQKAEGSDADVAAINAFYGQWAQALATRGAEGYVSFFADDGALLPPDGPAIEGKEAIRKWIQKVLEDFEIKDARLEMGPPRVSNGWAVRRFTISGLSVPRKGGESKRFNNKYLDVIQKQPDGQWKFLYRMWSIVEQQRVGG
ncbi:MAG TPA: SgcJ/EcaC family oxidoreductase [Blastocatellia bacterium]|nr:SgcJ/EcaC family oxidoreductase [Blastocatellia bacterium]